MSSTSHSMRAPQALGAFYGVVHDAIPQTKNGGAIGDARHVRGGGYHLSPRLLHANGMSGDYSLQAPRDRAKKDDDRVSAQDITFTSTSEIKATCKRLMAACERGALDGSALREWFGTIDGWNITGYSPYRKRRVTSSDTSHRWHIHFSFFRDSSSEDDQLRPIAEVVIDGATHVPMPGPVVKDHEPDAPGTYRPSFPGDKVVFLSRLEQDVQDSDSVWWVQRALNKLSLDGAAPLPLTGDYDSATVSRVKLFQKLLCNDPADGELGPLQTRRLLDCAGGDFARLTVKVAP